MTTVNVYCKKLFSNPVLACALTLTCALTTGCAGPITPFGPISGFFSLHKSNTGDGAPERTQTIQVGFTPSRQVLHAKSNFSLTVEDKSGIPETAKVALIYKGFDVTDAFIAHLDEESFTNGRHKLVLKFKNLRLPAGEENLIDVLYARDGKIPDTKTPYHKPECSVTSNDRVHNTGDFSPPKSWLAAIVSASKKQNINPNLYTGLIAQESGFRPKALSWAKAMGLSQITPVADKEISSIHEDWPRYKYINETPYPLLKAMLATGEITSNHDWRLNPRLSIEGGVTYLGVIKKYWELPQNKEILRMIYGDDSEVPADILLASYQSGPARIAAALKTYGKGYLATDELGEARTYVNRISSFCYYFGNEELSYADET